MSRFSKFCKFLSENGAGLKLVAFYIAAQQLFIAHNEQDPDFPLLKGLFRDRFFDETSCWCLPTIMLSDRFTIGGHVLQPNNIDYYLVMSKRVLSRLCLYWLPRYLLDLRMKDLSKDRTFSNEKFTSEMNKISDDDLHQQIFKTTSLQYISTTSISDLSIMKMTSLDGSSFNEIERNESPLKQQPSLESDFEIETIEGEEDTIQDLDVVTRQTQSSRRTAVRNISNFGIEKSGFGTSLIGLTNRHNVGKASLLRPRKTLKKRTTNYNRSIEHAYFQRRRSKMWLRPQEVTNRGDSFYTLSDDNEYRHENRHLMAALRSDDLAAGPFLSFLIEDLNDIGMYAIYYWQEVEKFRENFSGMQQQDRQDAFEEILKRFVLNEQGFEKVPGMKQYEKEIFDIKILECMTFPWPLRIIQKHAMEILDEKWIEFICTDAISFYERNGRMLNSEHLEAIIDSITDLWASETKPSWLPEQALRPASATSLRKTINRESQVGRRPESARPAPSTQKSIFQIQASKNNFHPNRRLTLGYQTESQIHTIDGTMTSRDELLKGAMIRRTKRAYQLAQQTCRLASLQPKNAVFISDESDEEGFVRPKPKPIYFRHTVKPDLKLLSEMSEKEYPGADVKRRSLTEGPPISEYGAPEDVMGPNYQKNMHKYVKQRLNKNGLSLKRPNVRPKHLIDCLKDPVHYEFFHRFAKHFHFAKSIRFWRAVENIKNDSAAARPAKIQNVMEKFFVKGAAAGIGLGSNAPIFRDLSVYPPDKVTTSMLITAQACVLKELEDSWGETYLSTFPERIGSASSSKHKCHSDGFFNQRLFSGTMGHAWKKFYEFIRRTAKFFKCMKNLEERMEFEKFLETIGRDPEVYKDEEWTEIPAIRIDKNMNEDLMYHQIEINDKPVIAEFLIYDFRFWYEVEAFKRRFMTGYTMNSRRKQTQSEDADLESKAEQICSHYLQSNVLPKRRINVQPEVAETILENVKIGMTDATLFHDCVISIFPHLIILWKKFCLRKYQYIPRSHMVEVKKLPAARRFQKNNLPKAPIKKNEKSTSKKSASKSGAKSGIKSGTKSGTKSPAKSPASSPAWKTQNRKTPQMRFNRATTCPDPLVATRLSYSWTDIQKTGENKQIISFSLCNGLKLAVPPETEESKFDLCSKVGSKHGSTYKPAGSKMSFKSKGSKLKV